MIHNVSIVQRQANFFGLTLFWKAKAKSSLRKIKKDRALLFMLNVGLGEKKFK